MKSLNNRKFSAITSQEMSHIVGGKKTWVVTDIVHCKSCISSKDATQPNNCVGILLYTEVYEQLENSRGKVLDYRVTRD